MGFGKKELKGLMLMINGYVKPAGKAKFIVKSETTDNFYEVLWADKKWTCTCEDYKRTNKKCKHIFAAIYYMVMREIVVGMREPREEVKCPECGLDDQVIKRGFAYEKSGRVQRYYCKRCDRRFNYRSGLEGMRGEVMAILLALDLFFRGLSLRQISQHLESVYGIQVSHTTIHGWIKRYVEIVNQFVEKIKVCTGDESECAGQARYTLVCARQRDEVPDSSAYKQAS